MTTTQTTTTDNVVIASSQVSEDDVTDHDACCIDRWIGRCGQPLDIPATETSATDEEIAGINCVVCNELFLSDFCPHGGHCPNS